MRVGRVLGCCIAALMTLALEAAEYRVGYAAVDITPPLGIPIPGYPRKRIAASVHDPLEIVCIAFNDGRHTALIFTIDNCSLDVSLIKTAAEDATFDKIQRPKPEAIYINATHTHTGGMAYKPTRGLGYTVSDAETEACLAYRDRLADAARDAAEKAVLDMAPVKMFAVATGEAKGIAFCRRYLLKDGTYATNPHAADIEKPADTPDESLQVLGIVRKGKPVVMIVNFGCHPDTIGGTGISADWPGVVRRGLGKDGKIQAMLLNGAQGDINTRNPSKPSTRRADGDFTMAQETGDGLIAAVKRVWKENRTVIKPGFIHAGVAEAEVKYKKPTPEELEKAQKIVDLWLAGRQSEVTDKGAMNPVVVFSEARMMLRTAKLKKDSTMMSLSALAFGEEIAFCGFPGEPFSVFGKKVKAGSPFKYTFVSCITGGSSGYLASDEAYEQGGYEPRSSIFAPGIAGTLIDAQLKQLTKLYNLK